MSFFSYTKFEWSWEFILIELIVIIVGRFGGTVGLVYFLSLFGHKKSLTLREIVFISYAGLIRGAIAFGLVLQVSDKVSHKEVIVTTALTLVIFTTVIFGSLMPLVQKCLLGKEMKKEKTETDENENPLELSNDNY